MTNCDPQKRWEIWLAKVAFEDNPNEVKQRPVLVLHNTGEKILSVKITSHSPRNSYSGEYEVQKWEEAGLHKPSTIRVGKLSNMDPKMFVKKLGDLQQEDIKNVTQNLFNIRQDMIRKQKQNNKEYDEDINM